MYGLLSYSSSKVREYQAGSSKQDDPVKFLKGAMAILLGHLSWQAQSQKSPATLSVLSWCFVHIVQISVPSNKATSLRSLLL